MDFQFICKVMSEILSRGDMEVTITATRKEETDDKQCKACGGDA